MEEQHLPASNRGDWHGRAHDRTRDSSLPFPVSFETGVLSREHVPSRPCRYGVLHLRACVRATSAHFEPCIQRQGEDGGGGHHDLPIIDHSPMPLKITCT